MRTQYLTAFAASLGLAGLANATLIHHWTLEGGLADGGTGNNPLVLTANAALASGTSPVSEGSIFVTPAAAPANGGARTTNNINWGAFANGDTRTIAFWAKPRVGQELNANLFSSGTTTGNGARFDVLMAGNFLRVEIQGAGFTTNVRLDTDRWHHVAIVVPNSISTMGNVLFYVDGVNVPNTGASAAAINTGSAQSRIGDSVNGSTLDRDLNGFMDDVRVYDNALTGTEITGLFTAGRLARELRAADAELIIGESTDLSWEGAHLRTPVSTGTADGFALGANQIGASTFDFGPLTSGPVYYLRANNGTYAGRLFRVTAFDGTTKTFTLEDGDALAADGTAILWTGAFDLFSYVLSYDTLTITNDQDASVIDAADLANAATGMVTIAPAVTTTYTLTATAGATTDTRQVTVVVKTTPDINTFTGPALIYGAGTPALAWTTEAAKRIQISDGVSTLATYTLTADGQPFLDAGTFTAPSINASTSYTLSAWLNEDGSGTPSTFQRNVVVQPAPDFTLHVSPPFTSAGQAVTLAWNATTLQTTAAAGSFEFFAISPGEPLTDSDIDFSSVLQAGTDYFMEVTNGAIQGSVTPVVSWSGNDLIVTDNFASNISWTNYRVFTIAGTDQIVIHDGTTTIATITDPIQIASGSLVLDPGPTTTTIYTATASITGATSNAVDIATVTVGGPGTSYPAVVTSAGPVAYYRFEENTGSTTAYDSSGNGNHSVSFTGGVVRGVTGPLGSCYDFTDNGTVTTSVTLNPQDPDGDDTAGDVDPDGIEGWSLEILLRPDVAARAGVTQNLFANQDSGGTGRSNFYLNAAGHLSSFIGNTASPNALATSNTGKRAGDMDWLHAVVTCTHDSGAANYTLRFYMDGVPVAEQILQTPEAVLLAPESSIGRWVIGSHKARQAAGFFDGLLDEAAIYDRALSPSEVAAHAAAFLASTTGALALDGNAIVVRGQGGELRYKTGGLSSAAMIDNGVGSVPLGTSGSVAISPTSNTTYTLDVDGQTLTFAVQVIDPATITAFATDNGLGFPVVTASGLATGVSYQLWVSPDLSTWTATGAPVVGGVSGTGTFTDTTTFDPMVRPKNFYRLQYLEP